MPSDFQKRIAAWRDTLVEKGCYGEERNLRIFNKWYKPGPRSRLVDVIDRYNLSTKMVAEVGCGYGGNLIHYGPHSYGVEILPNEVNFINSVGMTAYERDIVTQSIDDLPKAEAIVSWAVLEHVVSPHIALRKMHQMLLPGGKIFIYVPTIPLFPFLGRFPKFQNYFWGHRQDDHINAYTKDTIRFFAERAGFKTIEVSPGYRGIFRIFNHLPIVNRLIDGCVYIGEAIPNFEYPKASTRKVSKNLSGFEYK